MVARGSMSLGTKGLTGTAGSLSSCTAKLDVRLPLGCVGVVKRGSGSGGNNNGVGTWKRGGAPL